jgi:hypothetical protein
MRFLIAALVLLTAAPAVDATSVKAQCKNRCQVNYKFCLNRATTKKGKAQCKVERKSCHGTCGK